MHHLIQFVLLIVLLLSGVTFSSPKTVPVLFSNIYVNGASGYQFFGWLIDSSGVIRKFSFVKSDSMDINYLYDPSLLICKSHPEASFCSNREMWSKLTRKYCSKMLSLSVATNRKISADTLEAMKALIPAASSGSLSSGGGCFDAGEDSYIAYMPDSVDSLCNQVLCYQRGDQWTCNASPEAKKLSKWLISIDSGYSYGFCEARDSACNSVAVVKQRDPQYGNANNNQKIQDNYQFGLDGKMVSTSKRKLVISGKAKTAINMK
jgi:hypothetical protein